MKTAEVHVTAGHIAKGFKQDCGACPIALALASIRPIVPAFEVHAADVIFFTPRRPPSVVPLPDEARDFIWRFDRDDPVSPFTFTLQIPEEVAA